MIVNSSRFLLSILIVLLLIVFLIALLKWIVNNFVPIFQANTLYLRTFHYYEPQVPSQFFFLLHPDHLLRIIQDQIHRFIPTFEIPIHFPPPTELDYQCFVLQLVEFNDALLWYPDVEAHGRHGLNNIRDLNNNKQVDHSFKQQSFANQSSASVVIMREFEADIYKGIPPFGTSLFHREVQPTDESFVEMARFTFFPYFITYSFCFFWLVLICFVFFYSQNYRIPANYIDIDTSNQFLKVSQAALFELGENYPYHIVTNYHYYRVLTSMVLFRNFHHFALTCLGIITLGSYIEKAIGFKRCFVLAVATGVIGILCNNVVNKNATLESTTPMSGIIGYSFGYFFKHANKDWKYYVNEKINMILLLLFLCFCYGNLILDYSNVNMLSNLVALVYGFLLTFAERQDNEKFSLINIIVILMMATGLAITIVIFFFHIKPNIIEP